MPEGKRSFPLAEKQSVWAMLALPHQLFFLRRKRCFLLRAYTIDINNAKYILGGLNYEQNHWY